MDLFMDLFMFKYIKFSRPCGDPRRFSPNQQGLTSTGLMINAARVVDKAQTTDLLLSLSMDPVTQKDLEAKVAAGQVVTGRFLRLTQRGPNQGWQADVAFSQSADLSTCGNGLFQGYHHREQWGYNAGAGYDMVTGIGAPDVADLVKVLTG